MSRRTNSPASAGQPVDLILRPAVIDHDIHALDKAAILQTLVECEGAHKIDKRFKLTVEPISHASACGCAGRQGARQVLGWTQGGRAKVSILIRLEQLRKTEKAFVVSTSE